MSPLGPRIALAALLLFFVGVLSPAQTIAGPKQQDRVLDRLLQDDSSAAMQHVAGHRPPWATPDADRGALPANQTLPLIFALSRAPQVQAAFDQLLADQQNPSSPRFHQWLTPQQIGQQFGPTQHDLDALTAWLTGQGFHIDNITPSRIFVQATAPVAVATAALHIGLHRFALETTTLQAPTGEPSMPAALAPIVSYIGGLTGVAYHTTFKLAPSAPIAALGAAFANVEPAPAPTSGTRPADGSAQQLAPQFNLGAGGNVHFLAPADFARIYHIEPLYNSGINGAGQRVMILGGSRLAPDDLNTWETLSALPAYQPNYIVGPNFTDPGLTSDGNQSEATLDFERAYGTAPGAQVDLVIAQDWLNGTTNANLLMYAINTVNDPIMSLSFGACELEQTPSYIHFEDSMYAQAAMQGISVLASSGDSGIAGCEPHGVAAPDTQTPAISDICASSSVTCVGGTQFSDTQNPAAYWSTSNGPGELSALGYIPEGAWNEPNGRTSGTFVVAATGGGPSTVLPKPAFQQGGITPADSARDTPDISFSASVHNAYFACLAYANADCTTRVTGFGGTSASAPSMAGITALIDQRLGARQGNLNPLLYRIAASTPAAFHDATPATSGVAGCDTATPSTCNNSDPSPTALTGGIAGYALLPGYDFPTGLGSLDVANFITAIALPPSTGTITANPSTITISQTVVFTATITGSGGTPTGTVQFFSNGAALGAPVPLANGVATSPPLRFPLAGTYAITGNYSGDASFSSSTTPPLNLLVTNPNAVPSTSALTASATSVSTLQSVSFTDTVSGSKGTATGTAQLQVDGASRGPAIGLVNGVANFPATTLPAGSHLLTARYSGDDNYSASTSNSISITVTAVPTTTAITIAPSTIPVTGTTVISATVTSTVAGGPAPTGRVTLMQGTASFGTLPLVNGTVSGSLGGIPAGVYPFFFTYTGDPIYAPSQSPTSTLTVTAAASGAANFSFLVASPSVTLAAGATSATNTLNISSTTGFTGTFNLACTVAFNGTPIPNLVLPTCTPNPASVTLAASSPSVASTLTLTTVAPRGAIAPANFSLLKRTLGGVGGGLLSGFLLLLLPRTRRRNRFNALASLVLASALLSALSGCGSGGVPAGFPQQVTPAGSYTVTVTGATGGLTPPVAVFTFIVR